LYRYRKLGLRNGPYIFNNTIGTLRNAFIIPFNFNKITINRSFDEVQPASAIDIDNPNNELNARF